MSLDSIISVLLSIPVGLVSGLYTGLIVTRYARFAELRSEALRVIRSVDFMPDDQGVHLSRHEDVPKLLLISSDLLFLQHKKAGEQMAQLFQQISTTNHETQSGKVSSSEYSAHHDKWQEMARSLPPSKRVLWALWGRI